MQGIRVRQVRVWTSFLLFSAGAIAAASAVMAGSSHPRILSQDEMATTCGGVAPCTAVGGPNCTTNSIPCSTTGCPSNKLACIVDPNTNVRCVQLDNGGTGINNCAKVLAQGNCCAVCGANCTSYYTSPSTGDPMAPCNGCVAQNFCGVALCNQYSCGQNPPGAPVNPAPVNND